MYTYEVSSLKSSTLLDKLEFLHSFFSKDLAEVEVTAYNFLKFITYCNVCFCVFTMKQVNLINRLIQSFVTNEV